MIRVTIIPGNPPEGYDGPALVYLPHNWFPEGRAFRVCDDHADALDLRSKIQDGMIPDLPYR